MSDARLTIEKLGKNRYKLAFQAESGNVTCEVSVQQPGRTDARTDQDRRADALHSAKRLVRAFCEGIPEN